MLSKTQVDRLGERLRKGTPADGDEDLLAEFIARHAAGLAEARTRIDAVPFLRTLQSSRVERIKTRGTLVEKLVRERSRLSSVQDVAGTRIILPPTLPSLITRMRSSREDQDDVVASLVQEFEGAKVSDRRLSPSHGYRAVHVIVPTSAGVLVEIQVRTAVQQAWAESNERLADVVGREIRYGERPPGTVTEAEAATGLARSWREFADDLADLELLETGLAQTMSEQHARLAGFGISGTELDRVRNEMFRDAIERQQLYVGRYLRTLKLLESNLKAVYDLLRARI